MRNSKRVVGTLAIVAALFGWACTDPNAEVPTSPTERRESTTTTGEGTLAPQAEMVPTPAGWYHRSCVHEVPNGARISRTGLVARTDNSTYQLPECLHPGRRAQTGKRTGAPVNDGWIEYAGYNLFDRAYGSLTARWNAPPKPQSSYSGTQVYYTFPGLLSSEYIIQPVLQYHWDGDDHWTAQSWHCDDGSDCEHGSTIDVSPGDEMLGTVTASDCQNGQCWWTIITRNLTTQAQSNFVVQDTFNYRRAVGGAVEVYDLISCGQYPDSSVSYYSIALHDQYGDPVSPSWFHDIQQDLSPECDFEVASTTSTATLYHDPSPTPPPPPPMSVTISGPSTWPAHQAVTVQADVSWGTPPFTYTWQVNGAPYCGNQDWCSKTMGGAGTQTFFWVKVTDDDEQEATDYHIVTAQ